MHKHVFTKKGEAYDIDNHLIKNKHIPIILSKKKKILFN